MKLLIALTFVVLFKIVFINAQILSYLVLKSLANSVSETIQSTSQNFGGDLQPDNSNSGTINYSSENSNNCNNLFAYRNDDFGLYHGLVTIPNPDRYRNVVKTVITVATRLGSDVGDLSLYKNKESSFFDVRNGLPLHMKVRFPLQNPLPKIHQIFLNDQLICSTPKGKQHCNLNYINFN